MSTEPNLSPPIETKAVNVQTTSSQTLIHPNVLQRFLIQQLLGSDYNIESDTDSSIED
jgi:hypothetical protein